MAYTQKEYDKDKAEIGLLSDMVYNPDKYKGKVMPSQSYIKMIVDRMSAYEKSNMPDKSLQGKNVSTQYPIFDTKTLIPGIELKGQNVVTSGYDALYPKKIDTLIVNPKQEDYSQYIKQFEKNPAIMSMFTQPNLSDKKQSDQVEMINGIPISLMKFFIEKNKNNPEQQKTVLEYQKLLADYESKQPKYASELERNLMENMRGSDKFKEPLMTSMQDSVDAQVKGLSESVPTKKEEVVEKKKVVNPYVPPTETKKETQYALPAELRDLYISMMAQKPENVDFQTAPATSVAGSIFNAIAEGLAEGTTNKLNEVITKTKNENQFKQDILPAAEQAYGVKFGMGTSLPDFTQERALDALRKQAILDEEFKNKLADKQLERDKQLLGLKAKSDAEQERIRQQQDYISPETAEEISKLAREVVDAWEKGDKKSIAFDKYNQITNPTIRKNLDASISKMVNENRLRMSQADKQFPYNEQTNNEIYKEKGVDVARLAQLTF